MSCCSLLNCLNIGCSRSIMSLLNKSSHHAARCNQVRPASLSRGSLRITARAGGFPGMGGAPPVPAPGEVAHDPEDLYKGVPVRTGIIERRMMTKRMETDKEFAKAMANASDELRAQALLRRETRRPPANHQELVEYFLNTVAEDLEYEVARYRPRLTSDFFQYLDNVLGQERFAAEPDEDKVAELDLLRRYLAEASEAVDKCVTATATAAERLKKLLTSKDKKETILEMAAANEIDQALMDLLQQNIEAAQGAGQEDAAKFMEKVKQACAKYMVRSPAEQAAMPVVPGQLGTRPDATGIPIIGATATDSSKPAADAAPTPAQSQPASKIITPGKNDPSGLRSAGKLII